MYLPELYYAGDEYMGGWALEGFDGEGLRTAIGPNIAPGDDPSNYNYTYIPYAQVLLSVLSVRGRSGVCVCGACKRSGPGVHCMRAVDGAWRVPSRARPVGAVWVVPAAHHLCSGGLALLPLPHEVRCAVCVCVCQA